MVRHPYHPDGFQCVFLVVGNLCFLGSLGSLPWWSLGVGDCGWNNGDCNRRAFGSRCDSARPEGVAAVAVRSRMVVSEVSEVMEVVLVLMKDKTGST